MGTRRISLWRNENVQKLDCGDGCRLCEYIKNMELYTLSGYIYGMSIYLKLLKVTAAL